jgi:nucleoside-diphosphate-sugar epimerase
MTETRKGKIVITGAAGLVGQNLIPRLRAKGFTEIVAMDKHPTNVKILKKYHPTVRVLHKDLAEESTSTHGWGEELIACEALVIAHAQIGGVDSEEFIRNNVLATERLLEAAIRYKVPYIISISSSVVNSMAVDNYTETKKVQEALVAACGIPQVVLRPTLMFGWFDRKHVGWLARFMQRVPIFPIPGSGRFLRQPLFAADFCEIITSCILAKTTGAYNITGQERIDYIDLIRAVKKATHAKVHLQKIPYSLFWSLLKVNSFFDKNPVFTVKQLQALVTPDVFEVIDWPALFRIRATPLQQALDETFQDPVYSQVVLDF